MAFSRLGYSATRTFFSDLLVSNSIINLTLRYIKNAKSSLSNRNARHCKIIGFACSDYFVHNV